MVFSVLLRPCHDSNQQRVHWAFWSISFQAVGRYATSLVPGTTYKKLHYPEELFLYPESNMQLLSVIAVVVASASAMYNPVKLIAWEESDSQGKKFSISLFDNIGFAQNLSNAFVSRSFKLSRPLQCQEQLDISVTRELDTWFPNKDQVDQLSFDSPSCDHFLQSYSALNGSAECHNTPELSCHRLWMNPGL
jgi:hypothetical protein